MCRYRGEPANSRSLVIRRKGFKVTLLLKEIHDWSLVNDRQMVRAKKKKL